MINSKTKELITKIQEYLSSQPVIRAWLFGSYSRGEENADSDIDILVDYDRSAGNISLFKMGGMLMDLSELLGRKVDLVDNEGLLDFARPSVEHDKILIYERSA
ncbi:MAG: nucleotidyltransferase domain-containing protein [Muribaculaceae bacterium]|nr:nucleotidyltransferase domain-containing protein [Muribaculaceae bacterium]